MPSLPTSLIIVGLVVAWLVVLVPMVAKRREQVPENLDESANFRVLHRDSKTRRRPMLSRTAMAHRSRGDAGEYDAVPGEAPDDEVAEFEAGPDDVDSGADRGEVAEEARADAAVREGEAGLEGAAVRDDAAVREDAAVRDRAAVPDRAAVGERAAGEMPTAVRVDSGNGDAEVESDMIGAPSYRVGQRNENDGVRGAADSGFGNGQARVRERGTERAERGAGHMAASAFGDVEYRRTPIRQGRGGFDPAAADRAQAYRFRQRQRVALLLLALLLAGAVVGYFGSGYGYAASAASGVMLVLYLAYLRRQVRIESEIRRRRAARFARARQIRPGYRPSVAEQVYAHRTGEVPRPGQAEGYRVVSHVRQTVPPSGYGYGEPVDFEDSDPAFDDLEYYRPAAYRRRAG